MGVSITLTGLKECQQFIDNYAKTFPQKMELFLENLMNAGIPVVDMNMNTAGDSSPQYSTRVEVTNNGDSMSATLWVSGVDLAFIEFGAGIYYNGGGEHPKASEFGVGIGTYGKGQGKKKGWYYYDDGVKTFSRGTKMNMPVFKASEEMINRFHEIAKESFGI